MPQKGTIPNSAWYPIGDNYVVAPEVYAKRQTPGKCTRCGNLYEPSCKEGEDNNFCWSGMYSQAPLVEGAVRIPVSLLCVAFCVLYATKT